MPILDYILIKTLETHSDAWWTLVVVGVLIIVVIGVLLLMRWESRRATSFWEKNKDKKF